MITLKELPGKAFETSDEAMRELIANKKMILAAKKAAIKYADALPYHHTVANENNEVVKASSIPNIGDVSAIKVAAVSNACNYFDSHGDVSIPGSWNRTAKNTKDGLHLQEHQMRFDKLISDNVTFAVESKTWEDLGYNYQGNTDCLVMYSQVEKDTNPFMFERYVKGKVKNHSAGLRYVNIEMAVNNNAEWAKEEKAIWDKYYDQIINKEDVDQAGFFYPVLEQKIIENSAVLKGSNPATPTISVEPADSTSTKSNESAPEQSTPCETKEVLNLNLF